MIGSVHRIIMAAALLIAAPAQAGDEPSGFVRLRDVAPTVLHDMRYARADNFTGAPIDGYLAGECVLERRAANAVARAQADLERRGFGLVVFDCYRPSRAVAHFGRFMDNESDGMRGEYYPRVPKTEFVPRGYVARRSAHSRGGTVDVGLVGPGARESAPWVPGERLIDCAAPFAQRRGEGVVDLGTNFDCFDPRSASDNQEVSKEAKKNRKILSDAMIKAGFKGSRTEWWHFSLVSEMFPATYFDFPVKR